MKKFLGLAVLCVTVLTVSFEAWAWTDGATGIIVAVRMKKKALTKKAKSAQRPSTPVTKLTQKQFNEFAKICKSGSLQKFKEKFDAENISPNALNFLVRYTKTGKIPFSY